MSIAMKFILASQSPYRQNLLKRAGFAFQTASPLVDEENLKREHPLPAEELTRFLALKKAESLIEKYPDQWIVGCDQAAVLGKTVLNKPGTREQTIEQLKRMAGKWHALMTSMALVKAGEIPTVMTNVTKIKLRSLSIKEIEAYVDLDRPFDCAGSYKIEKAGIALIEDMRSKDPTAIEGLSVVALTSFFIRQGFSLAEIFKMD
jgi:septum formation protein